MKRILSQLVFLVGLGAVVVVVLWLRAREPEAAAAAGGPPRMLPVTLGDVDRTTVAPTVRLTGRVRAAERAEIGFVVAGRVASLAVREADDVEPGAEIARLVDGDEQVALQRATAALELAQRELQLLEAGSRSETVRRLEAEVEAERTALELAEKELVRGDELVRERIISQSQYDALETQKDAAASRLAAKREELAEALAGTRAEDLAVARARVAVAEADVADADFKLDKTVLRAPFAAHVVQRLASVGDSVTAGAPIYELVDRGQREIAIEIPGRYTAQLGVRPRVVVTVDDDPAFRLETTLTSRVRAVDPQSGNFRGILTVTADEDPDGVLEPGRFVRLQLSLEPWRDVLSVPTDAVRRTPEGDVVVRAVAEAEEAVGPGGPTWTAEWIPVRVLGAEAGRTAVRSIADPLAPGDRVVVVGLDLAFPGTTLVPRGGASEAPDSQADAEPSDDPPSDGEEPGT